MTFQFRALEYSRKPITEMLADFAASLDDFEGVAGLGPTPEDAADDLVSQLEAEGLIA